MPTWKVSYNTSSGFTYDPPINNNLIEVTEAEDLWFLSNTSGMLFASDPIDWEGQGRPSDINVKMSKDKTQLKLEDEHKNIETVSFKLVFTYQGNTIKTEDPVIVNKR